MSCKVSSSSSKGRFGTSMAQRVKLRSGLPGSNDYLTTWTVDPQWLEED